MLNDSCMVLFCLRGPFEASLYEITFGRRLVREEKETRLMWVYCATYKHDLFFSSLMWGGGGVFMDLHFVSFHKNAKRTPLEWKKIQRIPTKAKMGNGRKEMGN